MEGFDRRKFLKGSSVAAGLAGAMTVVPGALPALAKSTNSSKDLSPEDKAAVKQHIDSGAPVVAHVRDAKTGQIDVFVGTQQFTLQDRSLANRILGAAR